MERERQKRWVPKDSYGKVCDTIMDPHIRRGIAGPKECDICKNNYGAGTSESKVDESDRSLISYQSK